MSFPKFLGKTCGFFGYCFQYACITHCTFEYVGDFVMLNKRSEYHAAWEQGPATEIHRMRRWHNANQSYYSLLVYSLLVNITCSGPSMEPTLESNNILLTEHITPRLQRLRRGDIVIARSPSNPKMNICKRITALPGDQVGGMFSRRRVVPRGHVWLEGDNSSNSADSRSYGPVAQGLIRSRVICRVWPLDKIASLVEN